MIPNGDSPWGHSFVNDLIKYGEKSVTKRWPGEGGWLKKVVSFINISMKENVNILHFKTLSENSFYVKLGHILQVYQ